MYACSLVGTTRKFETHVNAALTATRVTIETGPHLSAAEITTTDLFELLGSVSTPVIEASPSRQIIEMLITLFERMYSDGALQMCSVPRKMISALINSGHIETYQEYIVVPVHESDEAGHNTITMISMLRNRLSGIAKSCSLLARRADSDPQPRASDVSTSWKLIRNAVADLITYCDQMRETAVRLGECTSNVSQITDNLTIHI